MDIIKYIVIKRRGEGGGCDILFLLSIIFECYILCTSLFESVRLLLIYLGARIFYSLI